MYSFTPSYTDTTHKNANPGDYLTYGIEQRDNSGGDGHMLRHEGRVENHRGEIPMDHPYRAVRSTAVTAVNIHINS